MDLTIITRLGVSLALGVIIGLERGWTARQTPVGSGSDGVRNFALVGLLGGISALLAEQWGIGLLAVIFIGFCGTIITSYVLTAKLSQDYGTTTELALIITYILGAMVIRGLSIEAIAVAVIVAWLLKLKLEIRQTLAWLKQQEIIATLQLLLLAMVALPLLPNQDIGPWQAINPRAIGLLVLLILGISYVGYFVIRLGKNQVGILLTGLLGGLASSTATTISLSRLAQQRSAGTILIATAITLAAAMMSTRLLLEIGVINGDLARQLAIPLIILSIVPIIIAIATIRLGKAQTDTNVPLNLSNPVEMSIALQYTAILVVLSLLIQGAQQWFGQTGVYVISALSGLADVDAVTISISWTLYHF